MNIANTYGTNYLEYMCILKLRGPCPNSGKPTRNYQVILYTFTQLLNVSIITSSNIHTISLLSLTLVHKDL